MLRLNQQNRQVLLVALYQAPQRVTLGPRLEFSAFEAMARIQNDPTVILNDRWFRIEINAIKRHSSLVLFRFVLKDGLQKRLTRRFAGGCRFALRFASARRK